MKFYKTKKGWIKSSEDTSKLQPEQNFNFYGEWLQLELPIGTGWNGVIYEDSPEAREKEKIQPEVEAEKTMIEILLLLRGNRIVPADRRRLALALAKSETDFSLLRSTKRTPPK